MTKQIILALALTLTGLLTPPSAQAEEIVVVVNRDAPVDRLTSREIMQIYLGEKSFWGGTKINPVSYRNRAALQNEFLRRVVKISPDTYKKYWIKRIFREGGVPPANLRTEADLIASVAATKGAIGFLYAKDLPPSNDRLKTVFRIGD